MEFRFFIGKMFFWDVALKHPKIRELEPGFLRFLPLENSEKISFFPPTTIEFCNLYELRTLDWAPSIPKTKSVKAKLLRAGGTEVEKWSQTENSCPQCKVRFFWMAGGLSWERDSEEPGPWLEEKRR